MPQTSPESLPQDFPDGATASAMLLWVDDTEPGKQFSMCMSSTASKSVSMLQHLMCPCQGRSKLMVTAFTELTGMPPFSPSAATQFTVVAQLHHSQLPQSHNLLSGGPAHPTQLGNTDWVVPSGAPGGSPMTSPRKSSLQLLSLNVNGLQGEQRWAAPFAGLQAGPRHIVALFKRHHHVGQAEATQWCREGAGPTGPWDGPSF